LHDGSGKHACRDKKILSETDIRTKFITPAISRAGWDIHSQVREEVALTNGKILVRGQQHKRGPAKYADYIKYYKPNIPIAVVQAYTSLDDFPATWTAAGQKKLVIEEPGQLGFFWDALADEVGKELDPFDLICHVAFDQPTLTRRERANRVRKRDCFARYGDQGRNMLDALLDKYADDGIEKLEDTAVLKMPPLNDIGTPVEIVRLFGSKRDSQAAIRDMTVALYT
jgi:type I site-specific restriction endonuclease